MRLFDVNIFVYAHREDTDHHRQVRRYVETVVGRPEPVGYSPLALSGFIRVVTHPRVFTTPTDLDTALEFCRSFVELPGLVPVVPREAHWPIFSHLLLASRARGNLVPDAWFAALAIENDCTWVTTDRDYSRFSGLRVEYPLAL